MIGSLRKGFFERRTSTEIKAFYRLILLDSTRFVLPCFVTRIQTICLKSLAITLPKNGRSPLPVDLCRSKTSLLELPNEWAAWRPSPSVAVTGPRGRPHYFQTKLKKNFWRPPPSPLSQSLNDRTPTPYLKVWIRHCVVWMDERPIRFHIRIYVNGASVI